MNPDQAARVLSEPKYVVAMIDEMVKELGLQVLEPLGPDGNGSKPLNALHVEKLRGIVQGLRMARNIFTEARQILTAVENQPPQEVETPIIPPALASAHLHPKKVEEASSGS